MINFYNYRLAPWMLCKLLYDVVPWKFHRRVIFSYGRRHMPRKYERSAGVAGGGEVRLNLRAIAFDARDEYASRSACIWRQMLEISFHEFGHIALGHCKRRGGEERYEDDQQFRWYIENQADAKAKEWMGKVLACDGRLYQPDFLGVVDIIQRRHEPSLKEISRGSYFADRLQSYRCHITGGQLSLSDVALNLHIKSYEKKVQVYGFIHKIADDLAHVHVDSAGRHHHFWVWGDLPIIAQRLASCHEFHEFIERLKKEKEKHIKNLKNEEVLF